MFTKDATGVLAGQEVDKEGLKNGLLALQKKWTKDSVQIEDAQAADGYQACGCLHHVIPQYAQHAIPDRDEDGLHN